MRSGDYFRRLLDAAPDASATTPKPQATSDCAMLVGSAVFASALFCLTVVVVAPLVLVVVVEELPPTAKLTCSMGDSAVAVSPSV